MVSTRHEKFRICCYSLNASGSLATNYIKWGKNILKLKTVKEYCIILKNRMVLPTATSTILKQFLGWLAVSVQ
jgi:hypothetical protein